MKRFPFAAVCILGIALFVRAHHITLQGAFLDEGFHAQRASLVYHFNVNSLAFADGKLLVYYWLGLFQGATDTALFVSRFAIALFSLITVAAVYSIGRRLLSAGMVAALIYAFLPLALFHERMALADPLAGGLACLAAWHSLTLARHPTRVNGAIQGVLLALAILAKLTVILVVLLPFAACLIYANEGVRVRFWLRRTLPALVWMMAVLALIWLPILVLARATGSNLFVAGVVGGGALMPPTIVDYLLAIGPPLLEFIGWPILIAGVCAVIILFVSKRNKEVQAALFLVTWLVLIAAPLIGFASIPAVRYFVPIAAPLALLIGCGAVALSRRLPVVRWAVAAAVILWIGIVGVPFAATAATAPTQLPVSNNNRLTYFGDLISADQAVRLAASAANTLDPDMPLYGDWQMWRLLYFYSARPINCLDAGNLQAPVEAALKGNAQLTLIVGYTLEPDPTFCATSVSAFSRPNADPITIWQVKRSPC